MNLQSDEWLNALPDEVTKHFQEISTNVTNIICERIKKIGTLSRSDALKLTDALEYLGADLKKIRKAIAQGTGKTEKDIEQIFQNVAMANDEFAAVYYRAQGIKPLNYQNDRILKQTVDGITEITKNIFKDISNISGSTFGYRIAATGEVFSVRRMYLDSINKAIYSVQSGVLDYDTAIKSVVKDLGGGIVMYKSGVTRRLDSAVRQNILDGARQLNQENLSYHGEQYGANGVELSAHNLSAPDHSPVQGRQFTNDEFNKLQSQLPFIDVNGKQYAAIERPIGEWNCKHFAFPIVIGVSEQFYSEEQLKNFEKSSAKGYPLTQKQRQYELNLRKLKDRRMAQTASGLDTDAIETQKKINALQSEYRRFCTMHGLTYFPKRASVAGYRPIKT